MIVHCAGFGSLWNFMKGEDSTSSYDPTRSVYLNTTGIQLSRDPSKPAKFAPRCTRPGRVRIHPSGFLFAKTPADFYGVNADADLSQGVNGSTNLLLRWAVQRVIPVDAVLIAVKSAFHGHIDFASEWRERGVRIVSASASSGAQETLLLVPKDARFRTSEGIWTVGWPLQSGRDPAQLIPADEDISACALDGPTTGERQAGAIRWSV